MRSGAGRVACGVIGMVLAGWWPGMEAASAAAIRGVVVNAGPPPERKQIPINIDQYVCGKSRESEDLVVGANRGIRWAVASLQRPPAGPRHEHLGTVTREVTVADKDTTGVDVEIGTKQADQGVTVIDVLASQAAEWVGSATARSTPPSSTAIVTVTLGKEKTGWR